MKQVFHTNTYIGFTMLVSCLILLSACNKYLDVQPKGYQLLKMITDYDQWLNNTALEASLPVELNQFSDVKDESTISIPITTANDFAYIWAPQFDPNPGNTPLIWSNHYKSVSLFNTVIHGVDAVKGTDKQKSVLKAEALLGRAFEYLYLVNEYGKEYDSATASVDLAVPFVTSDDLAESTPPRSTVQDIYDYIIKDINDAIPYLPKENSNNRYRGSVAAGYSVLARTYLYMSNFALAQKYAELALSNGPDSIANFNTLSASPSLALPTLMIRTDAIYARIPVSYSFTAYPTLSFLRSFNKKDLRFKYYYFNIGDTTFQTRGSVYYVNGGNGATGIQNWGTSVIEMRLIIAEAAARNNNLSTALQQLDIVRRCRILSSGYHPYQSTNKDSVLQYVLDERAFEFAFTGMRWFDMRRMNKEGRMDIITRYDGQNNIIGTLPPNSPRYTLQIPLQVMMFNNGWVQNQ